MIYSSTDNSILPDDTSGKDNEASLREKGMMKSVSAIQGLTSEKVNTEDAKETIGQGVPINNFDSLIAHMESLNIKFFN